MVGSQMYGVFTAGGYIEYPCCSQFFYFVRSPLIFVVASQRTIPVVTLTFIECLEPTEGVRCRGRTHPLQTAVHRGPRYPLL